MNKLSFADRKETPYEIWLQLAQWFLRRRCFKSVDHRQTDYGGLSYKLTNDPSAQVITIFLPFLPTPAPVSTMIFLQVFISCTTSVKVLTVSSFVLGGGSHTMLMISFHRVRSSRSGIWVSCGMICRRMAFGSMPEDICLYTHDIGPRS